MPLNLPIMHSEIVRLKTLRSKQKWPSGHILSVVPHVLIGLSPGTAVQGREMKSSVLQNYLAIGGVSSTSDSLHLVPFSPSS